MKNTIETPSGRAIFIRAPKLLSPAQLAAALGSMSDDDPRWLGVHQVLDRELAAAMLDVSSPTTANRDHAAGRVDALSTLKRVLIDARQAPLAPPAKSRR